jgi:hypothetical protein
MNLEVGNMWTAWNEADLFLITTNSTIKKNGALVMGAGIAKQARDRFSGLDLALGRKIPHMQKYGLLVSEDYPRKKLGAFQVKYFYGDSARLDLIMYSAVKLEQWIKNNPNARVHLNFPGIGNGKLYWEEVWDHISFLQDNVTLWTMDNLEVDPRYFTQNNDEDNDWNYRHPLDFGDK